MRRREFITLVGGTVIAWSLSARAQQSEHVRLIGIIGLGPDDPEGKARATVFEQTLQQFGWKVGRDLKIETRPLGRDFDRLRRDAAELVALAPDVLFCMGSLGMAPLQQATRTIPIVREKRFYALPSPNRRAKDAASRENSRRPILGA